MTDLFTQSITEEWHSFVQFSPRLIVAIIILAVSFFIGRLVRRATGYWLLRSELDSSKRNYIGRVIGWLPGLVGLLIALSVMKLGSVAAGLLAGGGLVAVVLGFAFRQIGENFLAGLILAFKRPFREGDYISCAGFDGTVADIQLRHSHIRTQDGRDIFIPNARLFTEPLINFTLDGLRRFEWSIGIDYRDDALRACQLLEDITRRQEGVLDSPAVTAQVTAFADNWLQVTTFFWIDVFRSNQQVLKIRTNVAQAVSEILLENGYTLSAEVSSNIAAVLRREDV